MTGEQAWKLRQIEDNLALGIPLDRCAADLDTTVSGLERLFRDTGRADLFTVLNAWIRNNGGKR